MKFALILGFVFVALMASTALAYVSLNAIGQRTVLVKAVTYEQVSAAYQLEADILEVQNWLTDISATRGAEGYDDGFSQAESYAKDFREQLATLQVLDPAAATELRELGAAFDSFYEVGLVMARTYVREGPAAGNPMMSEFDPHAKRINERVDVYHQHVRNEMYDELDGIAADTRAATQVVVGSTSMAALIGGLMTLLLIRSISANIREAVGFANEIASGNLSGKALRVTSRDELGELGDALNIMLAGLRELTQRMLKGVSVVTASTSEITAATREVTLTSENAVGQVAEVASLTGEVRQVAQFTHQQAQLVRETAQRALEVSDEGLGAMEAVRGGMDRIRLQMDHITNTVVKLSEQGLAIGDIIASVQDIAEQSHLLAINASIEAAKAGEDGLGFAVVAQEIKRLAQQSRESTLRVKAILNDIQGATQAAIASSETGNRVVAEGEAQTQQAEKAIHTLAEAVNDAATASNEISSSANQQLSGMEELEHAMKRIEASTAQSAAAMAQVDQTAESMNEMARELEAAASEYRL